MVQHALLCRYRGHSFRHSYAEVYDAVDRKLKRATPCDDLARSERHRRDFTGRGSNAVGEGMGKVSLVGLHVVFRLRHHHGINQNTGYLDVARLQTAPASKALNLHNHHSPAFLTAMACARLSITNASRSIVTLPASSAVVPRSKATVSFGAG